MKTILASAYAINPYKGSEDGMGWNFILQIARFQKVIAITRENNKTAIEKFISENKEIDTSNITFLYFDLPYWMRFWKKGSRGAMLYYIMWQKGIVSFIKKQDISYDIVHNLNFHNDWTPSFLYKLKKPMVWGPIGHHPFIPTQYLSFYKKKYLIKDKLTWAIKKYFWTLSPSLKKTVKNAKHIICMNSAVEKQLPSIKGKSSIIPSVATEDFGVIDFAQKPNKFTLVSAGRFVPLKGFDISIFAFHNFLSALKKEQLKDNIELILVGSGPEEAKLKNLVKSLNIEQQVRFINWIERDKLMDIFKNSSAFLFPSHEGAGMVVAEALSFGLPVICLQNEGPGEFVDDSCSFRIKENSLEKTTKEMSEAIKTLYLEKDLREKMSSAARNHFIENFDWNNRGIQLNKIYQSL